MNRFAHPVLPRSLAVLGLALAPLAPSPLALAATPASSSSETALPMCPSLGWEEGLINYLKPDFPFPTQDTPVGAPDCAFHQWSWEAFVWATALNASGVPRFMTLPTPDDLLASDSTALAAPSPTGARPLRLAARSLAAHGTPGFTEGAGAIVEADGNMLVAPNGYPVYASVHMNESYFATAKKNMIHDGGYTTQPASSSFEVGAAVFKATWLRLAPGQSAPAGAYTTQAEVPVLTVLRTKTSAAVVPSGQFTTVTVALVGLHVVGYTINHPEFLWGTFEHNLNSPQFADNTFTGAGSSPNNYTFYAANTPYSQANIPNETTPATLNFDLVTQRFSPVTSVVLLNQTGGENQPGGAANIANLNTSGQTFLKSLPAPQSTFANYSLIGTVWMAPNSYNLSSGPQDAIGSVNLANTTAETFFQTPTNTGGPSTWQNCFSCHNPTSYSFQTPPPPALPNRLIALSHVLAAGSVYAVPNVVSVTIPGPTLPKTQAAPAK